MSYNMLDRKQREAAEKEVEKRYQALTAKQRVELLLKNKWERLRVVEGMRQGNIKTFMVMWKSPGGKEVIQSRAIREQLFTDMVMAGEIIRASQP